MIISWYYDIFKLYVNQYLHSYCDVNFLVGEGHYYQTVNEKELTSMLKMQQGLLLFITLLNRALRGA